MSSKRRKSESSRDSACLVGIDQLDAAGLRSCEILAPRRDAGVKLFLRVLEPIGVGSERRRTLDKRRVSGLRFSRATPLSLHRLPRLEQAALRLVQLVVGGSLIDLDAGNGLARFVSPRFLAAELLFGRSPFGRDLLALAAKAFGRGTGGAILQLIPDRRLLLTV